MQYDLIIGAILPILVKITHGIGVVFRGKGEEFDSASTRSGPNGSNGFKISGISAYDRLGSFSEHGR